MTLTNLKAWDRVLLYPDYIIYPPYANDEPEDLGQDNTLVKLPPHPMPLINLKTWDRIIPRLSYPLTLCH